MRRQIFQELDFFAVAERVEEAFGHEGFVAELAAGNVGLGDFFFAGGGAVAPGDRAGFLSYAALMG